MKTKNKYWLRVAAVGVLVGVGWVLYVSSKQIERNQRIEREVSALSEEAERIRLENETLGEKIGYLSSQDFKEQEAKEKLGLKKVNENVVAVKPQAVFGEKSASVPVEKSSGPTVVESDETQIEKWWGLFFEGTN